MKNTKLVVGMLVAIAILAIGIGFAAISNVQLNITGNAAATATSEGGNFTVKFTGTPTVSDAEKVTAAVANDTTASIDVHGLTSKGDKETATYTIQNASNDLSAALTATFTNSNNEYFKVTPNLAASSIDAGATTTLTVTVELLKTPIEDNTTSAITVTVDAEPTQPGA